MKAPKSVLFDSIVSESILVQDAKEFIAYVKAIPAKAEAMEESAKAKLERAESKMTAEQKEALYNRFCS